MKTAVEWMVEQLPERMKNYMNDSIAIAKAMEQEQIIDAYDEGAEDWCDGFYKADISAEQYYNETFKSE